jgi:protein gp37
MPTKIAWTEETANPFPGCRKVSPGCKNCYAERMARRLKAMGQAKYRDVVDERGWTGKVGCDLESMKVPGKGKMVFVNSMGDLFYEGVSDEQRDLVFANIARYRGQHTFQVLTKRPERMLDYLMIQQREVDAGRAFWWHDGTTHPKDGMKLGVFGLPKDWPLSNLWPGTTCENQEWADRRIPFILRTPAAVRLVSLEPLLGPIDLRRLPNPHGIEGRYDALTGYYNMHHGNGQRLGWVIIGCESGPGRRPCKPEWILNLWDQCYDAGVPIFIKQMEIDGNVVHDADVIANELAVPVDSIRQFPRQKVGEAAANNNNQKGTTYVQ